MEGGKKADGKKAVVVKDESRPAKDGTLISLDTVRDKNVAQLRRLNAALFPVKYRDQYYADAMACGDYTRLAFYGDVYVGAIACRMEKPQSQQQQQQQPQQQQQQQLQRESTANGAASATVNGSNSSGSKLYIMTMGVLAPYRGLGIGRFLLEHVLELVDGADSGIDEVYLHVQTNNEDAITFYRLFGFEITDTIHGYYRRLDPPDCYVLSRRSKAAASAVGGA